MQLMSSEEIRAMLADRRIKAVAEATNINRLTLYRIMNGVGDPRESTLRKLTDYLTSTSG